MTSTDDYWVGDTIDEGGFGVVVYGKHKTTDVWVAVKCCAKREFRTKAAALAVVREQRILKLLRNCSHTVNLYASFHDSQCVYLVLECCEAGTLENVLQGSAEAALYFGRQLLEGIAAIHSQQVAHCDIKPKNCLLTRTGRLKLTDFGSAIFLNTPFEGVSRGTAAYASPELIRGSKTVTVACDLWSLGCVLVALLTGKSPFLRATEALSIEAVSSYCRDPQLQDAIPDDWLPLVRGLVEPKVSERLGYKDATARVVPNPEETNASVVYPEIAKSLNADIDKERLIPTALWWNEAQERNQWKDGKVGWSAFLV